MAASDALPFPRKNVAYRVTFPIYDADGDLVAGAAGLDSEVSKDGGTFADCTNEATQIATSSGIYFLDLTATEMNADCVAVIVKTSTSGAKTTVIVLYPVEDGDIPVNVTHFGGAAGVFSGGRPEVNTSHWGGVAVASANVLIDGAITAAKIASDAITAAKIQAGAITASKFAAGAIDAAALAADAAAEIADAVLDEVVDGSRTLRQLARGWTAALLGKVSGMGSNAPVFRNIADDKDVISATTDSAGNRTAVTLDLS